MNDCRVVLVRPHYPGNVGAIARVMHNFGLSSLVLVAPLADHRGEEARRLATHGESILDQARVVADLEGALDSCGLAVATSAKAEGIVRETVSELPRRLMPRVAEALVSAPAALVFGPEPSGLTTAEISRCHFLMHVPTAQAFPALNLGQAVAICLYELNEALRAIHEPEVQARAVAPFADQERMFLHLQQALERIHFLFGPKAESLMHAMRHLLGRASLTPAEVKMLLGLARQLNWVVDNGPMPGPENPQDPPKPSYP
jgi:tRNA/rRNA methyltransferase